MKFNFPIASQSYIVNDKGLYACPECGEVLGKIFNVYNDNLYTLQCPTNREHCYRKRDISPDEAMPYKPIEDIRHCPICNSILKYNDELCLVCPNDISHVKPVKISQSEIERLGYHPVD